MNERPKDILQRKIDRDRRNGKMTRAKAIHYHCIDCMGYQSYEVKKMRQYELPAMGISYGDKNTAAGKHTRRTSGAR